MAKLYANENFPIGVVEQLRAMGHDVVMTHDTGQSDRSVPDDEVLKFAIDNRRAVITLNRRDFIRLHNRDHSHFGIVVCTVDTDFVGQAARIDTELRAQTDLIGRLIRVNRPNRSL